MNVREGVFRSPDAWFTRIIFSLCAASDLSLNPTQGFTLGYSLAPFQGSGGRANYNERALKSMTDRYELAADPYEDRGMLFEASAQFGEDLAGLGDVYLVNFIFRISQTPGG